MSVKKRFMEHLEAKGKIPKGYACGGRAYAEGGMVEADDEWPEDTDWNDDSDTSGEPISDGEVRTQMVKAIKSRRGKK